MKQPPLHGAESRWANSPIKIKMHKIIEPMISDVPKNFVKRLYAVHIVLSLWEVQHRPGSDLPHRALDTCVCAVFVLGCLQCNAWRLRLELPPKPKRDFLGVGFPVSP